MKLRRLFAILVALINIGTSTICGAEPSVLNIDSVPSAESVTSVILATEPPDVMAESVVLIEPESGTIIYEKNMNQKMYPASTTKILTALVTLDYFDKDESIKVGNEVNDIPLDSSRAGHKRGEVLTVENLIKGLIIPSGNDTSVVLASAVIRKIENDDTIPASVCEKKFADLLNAKAKELGCVGSNFTNPHGYHAKDHYTTAYDMALISRAGLENDLIREISSEKNYIGYGIDSDDSSIMTQRYNWTSHNMLLLDGEYYYEYATGLKTGFTNEAGDCVSASAVKDDVTLICVIFNSPDPNRWIDAKNLFEYGFNNFGNHTISTANDVVKDVELTNHNSKDGDTVGLIVKDDVIAYLSNTKLSNITTQIIYNESYVQENGEANETPEAEVLVAPISKDTNLGVIIYLLDGKEIARADVYAARDVEEITLFGKVLEIIKSVPGFILSMKGLITLAVIVLIVIIIVIITLVKRKHSRYKSSKYKFNKRRFK